MTSSTRCKPFQLNKFDHECHSTTTLFAALNVLNGAVLAACKPRHRHQEFLSFLREIDKAVPAELEIHCIADKAIRRGSFTSVKQLVQRIDHFVAAHNAHCQPFKWTATADSILEKLHRLCSRISGTGH
jgi:putative transposase